MPETEKQRMARLFRDTTPQGRCHGCGETGPLTNGLWPDAPPLCSACATLLTADRWRRQNLGWAAPWEMLVQYYGPEKAPKREDWP